MKRVVKAGLAIKTVPTSKLFSEDDSDKYMIIYTGGRSDECVYVPVNALNIKLSSGKYRLMDRAELMQHMSKLRLSGKEYSLEEVDDG